MSVEICLLHISVEDTKLTSSEFSEGSIQLYFTDVRHCYSAFFMSSSQLYMITGIRFSGRQVQEKLQLMNIMYVWFLHLSFMAILVGLLHSNTYFLLLISLNFLLAKVHQKGDSKSLWHKKDGCKGFDVPLTEEFGVSAPLWRWYALWPFWTIECGRNDTAPVSGSGP